MKICLFLDLNKDNRVLIFKPLEYLFKRESYFNGQAQFITHLNSNYGKIQL